jgi:hypothetical protein
MRSAPASSSAKETTAGARASVAANAYNRLAAIELELREASYGLP